MDAGPDRRRFQASPLQEVVLDIRVEPRSGLTIEDLLASTKELSRSYPQITRYEPQQFVPSSTSARTLATAPNVPGLLYSRPDSRRFIQVSIDGLSFNVLPPYQGWEALRSEALATLQFYALTCEPVAVVSVGLRYINQLLIPGQSFIFQDYLKVFPSITSEIPTRISAYYMQATMPEVTDATTTLVLTMSSATSAPSQGSFAILLDLDYRKSGHWEPRATGEIDVAITHLHSRAYLDFIACTTDRFKELIS